MKLAILGSGPAGLLAAHAAAQYDIKADIYSEGKKSVIHGAQFIHEEIPGIPSPALTVTMRKLGTRAGYASKVYGNPDAPCSWNEYPVGEIAAWSMQHIYEWLWYMYAPQRPSHHVTLHSDEVSKLADDYDLVISTIPAYCLCCKDHDFPSRRIWIKMESLPGIQPDSIVYNGLPGLDWYRTSLLFGFGATEYGGALSPKHSFPGVKPLDTNCNCLPNVVRAGRFGRWKKGVLVNDAYRDAHEAVGRALQ